MTEYTNLLVACRIVDGNEGSKAAGNATLMQGDKISCSGRRESKLAPLFIQHVVGTRLIWHTTFLTKCLARRGPVGVGWDGGQVE